MKRKIGILVLFLGVSLLLGSAFLFLRNRQEQRLAGESVERLMPQVAEAILDRHRQKQELSPIKVSGGSAEGAGSANLTEELPQIPVTEPPKTGMPRVEIDGHEYVGFIRFHSAGVELPVMADWSYPQLKIAPCRFSGDMYTDNLVIMAHNYDYHFGVLHKLRAGDRITVSDMDGHMTDYVVVAMDVLLPTEVEEMNAGEYDLTLFTCTYGGESRVTARCDRVE